MHIAPTEVHGTPVEALHDNVTTFRGEEWVTLMPEDEHDERLWEFSLTTGRLLQTMEG